MSIDRLMLRILDLFRGVFRASGINYEQFRAIIEVKLMMDNRRHTIAHRQREASEPKNTFITTLFVYMIFGIFMAVILTTLPSFSLSLFIFFSYVMLMIAMTLITDFSSVLLDTRDNSIILSRPVDSRTLFAARSVHILIYLGQLVIGLSVIPAIAVAIKYGVLFLLFFLLAIVLSSVIAVVITNALYLIVMQFTSEEKLKNVINYLQIAMAVAMMASYQLGPRLMSQLEGEALAFEINAWSVLMPPAWMTAMMESVRFNIFDGLHIALIGLAVIVPAGSLYLVNRYLAPIFNKKIGALDIDVKTIRHEEKTEKGSTASKISRWVTSSSNERSAFEVIYNILGRDRKLKLKIYPTFGYFIIFVFVLIFQSRQPVHEILSNISSTRYHILLIYMIFMVLQIALHEIPYSDDYKASWIYFSAPIRKPGEILSGTLKAIFVKLFVVPYIVISFIVIAFWGPAVINDIVFGLFNNFIMIIILAMISHHHLPLSMAPNTRSQSGAFVRGMLVFLLAGGLGFGHYLLSTWPIVIWGCIPIQVLACYLLVRGYKSITWDGITI